MSDLYTVEEVTRHLAITAMPTSSGRKIQSAILDALLSTLEETQDNVDLVKSMLDALLADCEYLTWLRIVFAIASLNWNCSEELARRWSMTSDKYVAVAFDILFQSYDANRVGGITICTLEYLASEAGWVDPRKLLPEPASIDPPDQPQPKFGTDDSSLSLIEQYVFLEEVNNYCDATNFAKLKPEALNRKYAVQYPGGGKGKLKAADAFDRNPQKRTANNTGWHPSEDEFIYFAGRKYFNTYRGPEVEAIAGTVIPWLLIMRHVYGEYVDLVLDHLAFSIQHPGRKITWQILLVGAHRTGKTLALRPIKHIWGSECKVVDQELIAAGWTGDAFAKVKIVVIEEVLNPGEKDFFNSLKARLANDDVETLNVKTKGTITQQNVASFYMSSNHSDALHFDRNEDKLLVIEGPKGKIFSDPDKAKEFYTRYANWIDTDGKHAVLHYLLERDVCKFSYGSLPVRTEALETMCRESMRDYQKGLLEMIDHRDHPFGRDWFRFEDVRRGLKDAGYTRVGNSGISDALNAAGYTQVRGQVSSGKRETSPSVWTQSGSKLAKATPTKRYEMITNSAGAIK